MCILSESRIKRIVRITRRRDRLYLAPEGRYVYRYAASPRNQSPSGATCDKFGDNCGRGRTGKREDGKEGSSLLTPLACPRESRDRGGGTQGGKNFAPLRYFSRIYNSLLLQHFDFLCERFNLPFKRAILADPPRADGCRYTYRSHNKRHEDINHPVVR